MDPRRRNRLPPGNGDDSLFWLGAGAGRRPALSYRLPPAGAQLKPYPHRRYTPMSTLSISASGREGKGMCNMVDVMDAPHSVELAALVRRYNALVGEALDLAAVGFTPTQVDAARGAAEEALRMIRSFALTRNGSEAQAASAALSAGEANLA